MNTYKKIITFTIICITASIVLFAHRITAQEQNQQQYDVGCEVRDVPSLKECVRKAKNKEVDLIRIMNIVECSSKEDCGVDLSNVEKAIKIYGINNTDTGFKRVGNFDYSVFTIKNSKDIVIGSFMIDDSSAGNCNGPCPPVVVIENTTNSTIDQLRTISAKNTAVFVSASSSIIIKRSLFTDSNAPALLFSTNSGVNLIHTNTFTHNHRDAFYEGCIGICTGAQVAIMPGTKNLTISKNIIKDGRIDLYDALGLYASGIDIAGDNVEDINISCNKVYNNTGNGIVVNEQVSSKNITVERNSIYSNGIDMNVASVSGNILQNNCFDASCKVDGC